MSISIKGELLSDMKTKVTSFFNWLKSQDNQTKIAIAEKVLKKFPIKRGHISRGYDVWENVCEEDVNFCVKKLIEEMSFFNKENMGGSYGDIVERNTNNIIHKIELQFEKAKRMSGTETVADCFEFEDNAFGIYNIYVATKRKKNPNTGKFEFTCAILYFAKYLEIGDRVIKTQITEYKKTGGVLSWFGKKVETSRTEVTLEPYSIQIEKPDISNLYKSLNNMLLWECAQSFQQQAGTL